MFKTGDNAGKWGSYDDSGKPLTTRDGEALSKSQQKSLAKERKNQEKAYEKLVKAAAEGGIDAYIASLETQLKEMQLKWGSHVCLTHKIE